MDARALIVSQIAFFAKATDHAVLGADRARVRVGAGGRTGGAAFFEDFVDWAFAVGLENH